MNRDNPRKITVEDLIRLKRAERPPAEFWAQFESELRSKQLAAIVVKRPWWDGASRVLAVLYRHPLPLGAAAALALTWIGVHQMGQSASVVTLPASMAVAPSHPVALMAVQAPASSIGEQQARRSSVAAASLERAATATPVVAADSPHVTQVPASVSVANNEGTVHSPFAEGFSVTLADFHQTAPAMPERAVFSSDREFEASVTPLSSSRLQESDPLARMDPSAERRARLLAPALPAYASSNAHSASTTWTKERADNDRIFESMDLYSSNDRSMVGFRF